MDVLIVMARYPRPGRVKTRIGATLGAGRAARIYRAFLVDLATHLGSDPRWELRWAFEPARSPFRREIAGGRPAFPQPAGDLGQRMAGCLGRAFAEGAERVVLIGSDLPHLDPGRVAEAFARLGSGADLVLGPAEDGGYYLVGAPDVPPVFDGIVWGESDVLARTLALAHAANRSVALLPELWDLDREEDLRRLWRDPVIGRLPATAGQLAGIFANRDGGDRVVSGKLASEWRARRPRRHR